MYSPELGRFFQPDPIGYADNMNMYSYCSNNPINFTDPYGLFRFGKRDLGDTFSGSRYLGFFTGLVGTGILNAANLGTYHEQGFFEDGSHENIGFFGPEADPANPGKKRNVGFKSQKNCNAENPRNYDISPWKYDDNTMRQAMSNVNSSGQFDPEDYKLMGWGKNNCQDYASALRKEYKRLGGKVKFGK